MSGATGGGAQQLDAQGNPILSPAEQGAIDAITKKVSDIDDLIGHAGLNTRVGPTGFARSGLLHTGGIADKVTGAGADFAGGVKQLIAQD